MTPPDPHPTAPPTVAPANDEEVAEWKQWGGEFTRLSLRIESDRAEMAEDADLIVRQNATIAGLSARVAELEEVLKAAIGHCDCLDYNGKALIPCTESNPCVGCSMAAQIRAALKPEPASR